MDEFEPTVPRAIEEAIEILRQFDDVVDIVDIEISTETICVECTWSVALPNQYKQAGVSDSGIRDVETVYWSFPANYPLYAPTPRLRLDFPTNLPHINPHKVGDRVPPCISEVLLTDLLHSQGLRSLLEACTLWLDNAAADDLHCPSQGWESVRRDQLSGMILVDTHSIRKELISNHANFRYYSFRYCYLSDSTSSFIGAMQTPALGSSNSAYKASRVGISEHTNIRFSPGVLLQPKKGHIADRYQPDTISCLGDLRQFARHFELHDVLDIRLSHIASIIGPQPHKKQQKTPVEEFLVVFALERPFDVIGTNSRHELIPYRVLFTPSNSGVLNNDTKVYPVYFMDICSPSMLRAVSGVENREVQHVSLIGCGSLGSKLALHLGKCGAYEFDLIDNDYYSSHNNARHGLIATEFVNLFAGKAKLLGQEISSLGVEVRARDFDIRSFISPKGPRFHRRTKWIIDTTASLTVRHFLAHHIHELPAPLIHTLMYGNASLGVVAIEGINRSPRIDDIGAYLNTLCIDSPSVRKSLYEGQPPGRQNFGEGCSSATSVISDVDLSLAASAITSRIEQCISCTTPSQLGQLFLANADKYTLNVTWKQYQLPETHIIPSDTDFPWTIRLVGSCACEIEEQSSAFHGKENGGMLAGKICYLSRTIYVTKILPAPEGSHRDPARFNLSISGLDDTFKEIHARTNGLITFLGTWHSHTYPEPPSTVDRETLAKLRRNSSQPIVMLVYTGGKIERVTLCKNSSSTSITI